MNCLTSNRLLLRLNDLQEKYTTQARSNHAVMSAFESVVHREKKEETRQTPCEMMQNCRNALIKLDGIGWKRSYHQRLFHEDFLKACTRIFWKTCAPGQFARDHQQVLIANNWDHLAQEILISTPRRFGKTISVSMFAAAMIVSCPSVEISVYSTCKRISQKLLRNIQKFIMLICDQDMTTYNLKATRQNMEEVVLQGPIGPQDIRIVNSYPSKVQFFALIQKSLYLHVLMCLSCKKLQCTRLLYFFVRFVLYAFLFLKKTLNLHWST